MSILQHWPTATQRHPDATPQELIAWCLHYYIHGINAPPPYTREDLMSLLTAYKLGANQP